MSFKSAVPPTVPSLFHSSKPLTPLLAENSRVAPRFVTRRGNEPNTPALMSLTMTVPASVPSLFQSSWPFVALFAVNRREPFTSRSSEGSDAPDGLMSLTSVAAAASVRKSGTPTARNNAQAAPTVFEFLLLMLMSCLPDRIPRCRFLVLAPKMHGDGAAAVPVNADDCPSSGWSWNDGAPSIPLGENLPLSETMVGAPLQP